MYSLNFPDMFTSASTKLLKDRDAVISNAKLVLQSNLKQLFGDPGYGVCLKKFLFMLNNTFTRDMIIDAIYTAILTYIPQMVVTRKDIVVYSEREKVEAEIHCRYTSNSTPDMFTISLTED